MNEEKSYIPTLTLEPTAEAVAEAAAPVEEEVKKDIPIERPELEKLSPAEQAAVKAFAEKIDVLNGEIKENEKGLDQIIETEVGIFNAENSKQQADAMKKYAEDMAKCLEIARRISNGDKVPATDEKKLMDFNMEIYMAAKNMAVMNMDKKHEEYDSLWGEEEEKEYDDPQELASNSEINIAEPAGTPADAAGEPQA